VQGFEEQVQTEYGKRGGSRWVDEAVIQLIGYKSWNELLIAKSEVTDGKIKQFNLSPRGADALERAIEVIRRGDPYFEGVISEIVRSAIAQRLLRSGYMGKSGH